MRKLEVFSFNKQIFHAVSLSGGKDSTAMLLLMIERSLPINTVLWADTGMEFPEMYDHIRKVDMVVSTIIAVYLMQQAMLDNSELDWGIQVI